MRCGSFIITNHALMTADGLEPILSNYVSYLVIAFPELQIIKNVEPTSGTPLFPGQIITYTLVITNVGNANTSAAVLFDDFHPSTTYISNSTTINGLSVVERTPGQAPVLSGAAVCSPGYCDEDGDGQEGAFPDGFEWGVAVAGFQIDMGCPTLSASECDDPNSDWYVWVTTPSLIAERGTYLSGDPMSHGPGHWELYDTDFSVQAGVGARRNIFDRLYVRGDIGYTGAFLKDHDPESTFGERTLTNHFDFSLTFSLLFDN